MSKRKKRVAGRSGTPRPEPSKTLRERIAPFLDSPWAPVVFFLLLSVAYFAGFVFTDHVILGQDTGTRFSQGTESHSCKSWPTWPLPTGRGTWAAHP